jgi:hypothetical protein
MRYWRHQRSAFWRYQRLGQNRKLKSGSLASASLPEKVILLIGERCLQWCMKIASKITIGSGIPSNQSNSPRPNPMARSSRNSLIVKKGQRLRVLRVPLDRVFRTISVGTKVENFGSLGQASKKSWRSKMKMVMMLACAAAASVFISAGPTIADEVTTTTTTTQPAPAPGVSVGVPGVGGVQVGPPASGCTTRSKTKTDTETGDSKSVTRSDC